MTNTNINVGPFMKCEVCYAPIGTGERFGFVDDLIACDFCVETDEDLEDA